MPHDSKSRFLDLLAEAFSPVRKLAGSQSLFEVAGGGRVYIRYSKVHPDGRTFFGLRKTDLQQLEGRDAVICFLWDTQTIPLLVPFREFEEVFAALSPASDGQFKAQVFPAMSGTELYIASAGRFNVESYYGWNESNTFRSAKPGTDFNRVLSHSQVQTLIGAIGRNKGFDVWLPRSDRGRLDWTVTDPFDLSGHSFGNRQIEEAASQIDVIWAQRGSGIISALFEVEHSTPIYSGLLRFNDVRLLAPTMEPRFTVVANDERRARFSMQINRPTFRSSGLSERCNFLDYSNVFEWHRRITTGAKV